MQRKLNWNAEHPTSINKHCWKELNEDLVKGLMSYIIMILIQLGSILPHTPWFWINHCACLIKPVVTKNTYSFPLPNGLTISLKHGTGPTGPRSSNPRVFHLNTPGPKRRWLQESVPPVISIRHGKSAQGFYTLNRCKLVTRNSSD